MFLLHSLHHSLSLYLTVVLSPNLSPQSSVQSAISGHPVTMATLATPGHGAAGAHSGMSLFLSVSVPLLLPSVSSVSIWSCSLSRSLGRDGNFTLFLHTSLPRVVLYTHPSISPSFVSFMCHVVCLSVCQETILQQGGGELAVPPLMWSA